MYIALLLLRDGAHLTITTRFPHDAARRFAAQEDSADWIHRLKVVGIDLRDPTQVVALADEVAAAGPLDILVNNAAQTVRRSPGAYAHLVEGEAVPLPAGIALPELVTFDRISEAHPANLLGTLREQKVAHHDGESEQEAARALAQRTAASMTSMALSAGHASLEAHRAGTAVDAGGLLPDLQRTNSWTQKVEEVDPLEMLEVQLCNSTAPFILVSRLRPAMRAAIAAEGWHAPLDLVDGAARVYDPIVRGEAGEDLYGCFLKDYEPAPW
jgi:hypothetical protein